MKTNVAATSIDAKRQLANNSIMGQYAQIESILMEFSDGTTRKHISRETKRNPAFKEMEPGTVAARVNEMVAANRLIDGPDTRRIEDVSKIASKVVRLA